jgi:hypothetical protein
MNVGRSLGAHVRAQFGLPHGFWGPLVGWIMAVRSSNRRRIVWAVSLLDVQRRDRVLEIGFGPGIAIEKTVSHIPRNRSFNHSDISRL